MFGVKNFDKGRPRTPKGAKGHHSANKAYDAEDDEENRIPAQFFLGVPDLGWTEIIGSPREGAPIEGFQGGGFKV